MNGHYRALASPTELLDLWLIYLWLITLNRFTYDWSPLMFFIFSILRTERLMISLVKSWNGSLEALMISIFEVSNEVSMKQAKSYWIEQWVPSIRRYLPVNITFPLRIDWRVIYESNRTLWIDLRVKVYKTYIELIGPSMQKSSFGNEVKHERSS